MSILDPQKVVKISPIKNMRGFQNEDSFFSGLWFIQEFGIYLVKMRIELAIRKCRLEDSHYYWSAKKLLGNIAYRNGSGELTWNPSYFLSVYPEFNEVYLEAFHGGQELGGIEKQVNHDLSTKSGVTLYCPRGCNQITVDADEPFGECAACGSQMLADAECDYYDSLVAVGQCL